MTRIALFTDLHANLPALEAILGKMDLLGADRIISLGDNIAIGSRPRECLDLIRSRAVESVMGNHEEYYLRGLSRTCFPAGMAEGERNHQEWVRRQLDRSAEKYIEGLPYRIDEKIEDLDFTFFHSPHIQDKEGFSDFINVRLMNPAEMSEAFSEYPSQVFCFGHSHGFMDWSDGRRYINSGSVGCHKGEYARFSLLEVSGSLLNVTHYQVPYDKEGLLADLNARKVPEREFIMRIFF